MHCLWRCPGGTNLSKLGRVNQVTPQVESQTSFSRVCHNQASCRCVQVCTYVHMCAFLFKNWNLSSRCQSQAESSAFNSHASRCLECDSQDLLSSYFAPEAVVSIHTAHYRCCVDATLQKTELGHCKEWPCQGRWPTRERSRTWCSVSSTWKLMFPYCITVVVSLLWQNTWQKQLKEEGFLCVHCPRVRQCDGGEQGRRPCSPRPGSIPLATLPPLFSLVQDSGP